MYSSSDISSTTIVKDFDPQTFDAYCRMGGHLQKLSPPKQRVSLGTLPDDILLEIFDHYQEDSDSSDDWQTLVHVCSRWRNIVFSSPRRLRLELYCSLAGKRLKMLDIWPTLPIYLSFDRDIPTPPPDADDNFIAVLQQRDRIIGITLEYISNLRLEKFLEVMQEPFPELIFLTMSVDPGPSDEEPTPVSPESFLGLSAPRLQHIELSGIPFPQLNKFLVSANCNNIYWLDMNWIPHSGYISPEAMATCLSFLSRLKYFNLGFRSPLSRPNRERLPPPDLTPTVLPTLTSLHFRGSSEYLEDLVSRIDGPLLSSLEIRFFHQLTFGHSQLARLISRAQKFKAFSQADIVFSREAVRAFFISPTPTLTTLKFAISCSELDWQISSIEQVCKFTLPSLSNIDRLNIREFRHWAGYRKYGPGDMGYPESPYDMDNSQWIDLFLPFTTVKDLYLCKESARRITPALQELAGERVTEVLPALQNISVEEFQSSMFEEDISQFVAIRELANHAIALHNWERER